MFKLEVDEGVVRYKGERVNCHDMEVFLMAVKKHIMDIEKIERITTFVESNGETTTLFRMALDNGVSSLWNIGE
jgi:hypothetical protein